MAIEKSSLIMEQSLSALALSLYTRRAGTHGMAGNLMSMATMLQAQSMECEAGTAFGAEWSSEHRGSSC